MNIPITKAIFDEAEAKAILKPLESGWVVQGPYVQEFETLFKKFAGTSFAYATTSCTTALHLGLLAMGIGPGDQVIVPAFTYVASANAVEYTGAEVVFCDVDLKTFNINVQQLETLLSTCPNVKAIMPVHLFGLCADMHAIMSLAEKYDTKVIEDAACGFDAWIGQKHAGTFGDCGCFSFHPRKSITTGEGGMLITQDDFLAKQVALLRDHGASKSDLQRHEECGSLLPDFTVRGYNYRMTDFQGALGVCQMQKAAFILQGRRKIARQYDEALKNHSHLLTPTTPVGYTHGYQSYVCLYTEQHSLAQLTIPEIDALNRRRNRFMEKLAQRGVATRQGTHAVHTLSYYQHRYSLSFQDFISAYTADRLSVTLPLYANMSTSEFNHVITTIGETLSECAESVASSSLANAL